MSRLGLCWGGILTLMAALAYGQPSTVPGDVDVERLIQRSTEAWNRRHRGAYSIRWTEDRDVAAVLSQWEPALPESAEGELRTQVRAVRVASEGAVLEVVWSLEGAMRQEGSFETRVTSAGAVRQAAK